MTSVLRNKIVVATFERCPFLNYTEWITKTPDSAKNMREKISPKNLSYNRTKKGKKMQGLDEGTECSSSLKSLAHSRTTQKIFWYIFRLLQCPQTSQQMVLSVESATDV